MANLPGRDARGQHIELIGQHEFGDQVGDVLHMCPNAHHAGGWCPVCKVLGSQPGMITTDQLAAWQRDAWKDQQ